MNLNESIRLGESKTLELKAQLPQNEHIAKTVVAFSNTSGGKLVIGVDDNRTVLGLPEQDFFALQERIGSILFDRCYPAILPEMYIANLEGKTVLVVEIFRGNLLPYWKAEGSYFDIGQTKCAGVGEQEGITFAISPESLKLDLRNLQLE